MAFDRIVPNHEVVTVWIDHDIVDEDAEHNAEAFDRTLRARLGSLLFSPLDLINDCGSASRKRCASHASSYSSSTRWRCMKSS